MWNICENLLKYVKYMRTNVKMCDIDAKLYEHMWNICENVWTHVKYIRKCVNICEIYAKIFGIRWCLMCVFWGWTRLVFFGRTRFFVVCCVCFCSRVAFLIFSGFAARGFLFLFVCYVFVRCFFCFFWFKSAQVKKHLHDI